MITHYQNSIYVSLDRPKSEVTQEKEMEAWEKAQAYADQHDLDGNVEFVETEETASNSCRLIFHVN